MKNQNESNGMISINRAIKRITNEFNKPILLPGPKRELMDLFIILEDKLFKSQVKTTKYALIHTKYMPDKSMPRTGLKAKSIRKYTNYAN